MNAIPDAAASTSVHYTEPMLFSTLLHLFLIILAAHGAGQVARSLGQPRVGAGARPVWLAVPRKRVATAHGIRSARVDGTFAF